MKGSIVSLTAFLAVLPFALVLGEGAPEKMLEIGEQAPDFSLPGVDGKTYSLKDFAGARILAVIFTCNHCPTAQAYENRIKKLVADYKEKGVAFVAISPNDPEAVRLDELGYTDLSDSFEEMKIRAKERSFNFPYLYDGETQKVSRAYGPTATPQLFLFDAGRKLRYVGRIDDSERENLAKTHEARDAMEAVLSDKAPAVEKTKTFGCSIKWSDKRDSVKQSLVKAKAHEVTLESIGPDALRKLVSGKSDKLRVINVWATWCGPCVVEFPELVTIQRMYGHRAFELVTVSADQPDQKEKVLAFLKKMEAPSRNYQFELTDKDKLFSAVDEKWSGSIPYTIVVRPSGEIVYRRMNQIDPLELRREIVKNLADDRS